MLELLRVGGRPISHHHRPRDDTHAKTNSDVREMILRPPVKTQRAQAQDRPAQTRIDDRRHLPLRT